MARVAIAGFQHETNTFVPTRAGFADFEMADSWPGLLRGAEVIAGTAGLNLPVAGFAAAAAEVPQIELVPLLWCAAEPSGPVTDAAFERIASELIARLGAAGEVDGLYLDLHGAMVTESHDDGEGELLSRLRAAVGANLPIAVSLDLHANISSAMVAAADAIAIYRTYPHLDMAATGARALAMLRRLIAGERPNKAFRRLPFLIPLHAQHTGAEPCRSLYALLDGLSGERAVAGDIALGFTAGDTAFTGPSVIAHAPDRAAAEALADRLAAALAEAEGRFDCALLSPAEAVRRAMAHAGPGPVVIADVQDNPGAGASSDTTGLLAALVEAGAQGAILGLMHDPEFAGRAHTAGEGAILEGTLGGRSGAPGDAPYPGRFRVVRLGDGLCRYTGAMYGGGTAVLGPSAVLAVHGTAAEVRVVVTSRRSQCLDLALFTHLGLDPRAQRIVAVKSTAHFRADFEPIAGAVLLAAAPGGFPCELESPPYRRLAPGTRLGPCGPPFSASAPGERL